ncbi:hypothetical protein CHF27_001935 [Romboutsia maritimum]|uniref:Uncharacterized protein n=1 Tax=Romboutsia maritimum TaxID=2020948 RepID=A0A371IWX7_9FIRM|nr:hypothetical protein [Romboutsia maritimum]RDY24984.1 hypothetical protein CHF27_001935 [Romboutsia maritimum]
MNCGKYYGEYIGNLEYVSSQLLGIINGNILPALPSTGFPVDVKDPRGVCVSTYTPKDSVVFDCTIWNTIKEKLINSSEESGEVATTGILVYLCDTLDCILKRTVGLNYGFAAQLERFLCLCESLETRLDSICCNGKCPEVIGDLLCVLMQILTKLISAVSKAAVLVYYATCDINPTTGNTVIATFFECMLCDLINDLCELEKLIPELSAIVIAFATCDMQKCTPCYTAPCAPKKVRPICPPNMMHYGNNGYGQNYGGCCGSGCCGGCNKGK